MSSAASVASFFVACIIASAHCLQVDFPPLKYDYGDYEPLVDAETMRVHHGGHFSAYASNTNAALREAQLLAPELEHMQLPQILQKLEARNDPQSNLTKLPLNISSAILNNGGGYLNHILYFNQLRPNQMTELQHTYFQEQTLLGAAIIKTFGSRQMFEKSLTDTCMKVFGSGWCWLEICGSRMVISWKPNQVSPVQNSCKPLLGIDVWEHAYYLRHKNKRALYLANMLQIINWDVVDQLFVSAIKELPPSVMDDLLASLNIPKDQL